MRLLVKNREGTRLWVHRNGIPPGVAWPACFPPSKHWCPQRLFCWAVSFLLITLGSASAGINDFVNFVWMLLTFSEKPLGFLVWVCFLRPRPLPAVAVRKAIEMLSNPLVQQQESERQTFKSFCAPAESLMAFCFWPLSLPWDHALRPQAYFAWG